METLDNLTQLAKNAHFSLFSQEKLIEWKLSFWIHYNCVLFFRLFSQEKLIEWKLKLKQLKGWRELHEVSSRKRN